MIEIRQAVASDLLALRGSLPAQSCRAFTAVEGGDPIGIAGVYRDEGYMVAFSHATERLRRHPKSIVKLAKKMMTIVQRYPQVLAVADPSVESSTRAMLHFGFRHLSTSAHGEVYQWTR